MRPLPALLLVPALLLAGCGGGDEGPASPAVADTPEAYVAAADPVCAAFLEASPPPPVTGNAYAVDPSGKARQRVDAATVDRLAELAEGRSDQALLESSLLAPLRAGTRSSDLGALATYGFVSCLSLVR